MDFKDVVKERYACKAFTSEKVSEEKISELIDIIRMTPTALNLQPVRVKVISDDATKAALGPAMFGQPHAINCSHLIILCANTDADDVIKMADKSMKDAGYPDDRRSGMIQMAGNIKEHLTLQWAQFQVFMALTNAVNGAKALGLDSCPMTGFDPQKCAAILGLPAHIVPTAVCPVGFGADKPMPKARLSRVDFLI
jgi:nitroreductase / dihydropteridine reductase